MVRLMTTRFSLSAGLAGWMAAVLLPGVALAAGQAGEVVLSTGSVQIQRGGKRLAPNAGQTVESGDQLKTGADGYLYLKLKDGTFIALRPDTRAVLTEYSFDDKTKANIRVRLQLDEGVMRTITGQGLKEARDRFRLNTPVAAIGVRGTDFTTYADATTTRVSVAAGGVAMAPLGGACSPAAVGPCEGEHTAELFAGRPDMMLQLNRDEMQPRLLPAGKQAPDQLRQPLQGETPAKVSANQESGADLQRISETQVVARVTQVAGTVPATGTPAPTPVPTPPPQVEVPPPVPNLPPPPPVDTLSWGRYQVLAGQPASVDLEAAMKAGREVIATNAYFAVMREPERVHMPSEGSASFTLQQSEAAYINNGTTQTATVQGGNLDVNFARSSFSTRLDVSAAGQTWAVTGAGDVTQTGKLVSNFRDGTNSTIRGALGGSDAHQAAYVFTRNFDQRGQQQLVGVTAWTR